MITTVINVHKTYGSRESRVTALNGVSLDINDGDYISIIGPSGSGKTTLLSLIGCLIHPSKGDVYYNKNRVSDISEEELCILRGQEIGFVFQFTDLLSNLNVLENVLVPVIFNDGQISLKKQYAKELLERLGLGYCMYAKTNFLSGGERQRVAIARAMINRPRLILADEPTGDLDAKTSELIIKLFNEFNSEGVTIILITHNRNFADNAKNIYQMGEGRIQKILK